MDASLTAPSPIANPVPVAANATRAEVLLFQATSSGLRAEDRDAEGGNPFASGLIQLLRQRRLSLSDFPAALKRLTFAKSREGQTADVGRSTRNKSWPLAPAAPANAGSHSC